MVRAVGDHRLRLFSIIVTISLMKRKPYVSAEYARTLDNLAESLRRPVGDAALQDTVEFEPTKPQRHLRLLDPPESGWELSPVPPTEAA